MLRARSFDLRGTAIILCTEPVIRSIVICTAAVPTSTTWRAEMTESCFPVSGSPWSPGSTFPMCSAFGVRSTSSGGRRDPRSRPGTPSGGDVPAPLTCSAPVGGVCAILR